jgi:2-methylcitrate dehydratase PrpD
MEYAAATALLDGHPGFGSFTDAAVQRPEAQRLVDLVDVELQDGGDWLLAGEFTADVHVGDEVRSVAEQFPPGSPQRPPTHEELMRKAGECLTGTGVDPAALTWSNAGQVLRDHL